ncbi:MAG: hypothetical protein H6883_14885 [Rhodobiaceae bacterium]|nr:hypothetical protein [Rhodobiaceae bacterium]MCC0057405.1 hypothetical protein [Rhodobiaceae bacterium]
MTKEILGNIDLETGDLLGFDHMSKVAAQDEKSAGRLMSKMGGPELPLPDIDVGQLLGFSQLDEASKSITVDVHAAARLLCKVGGGEMVTWGLETLSAD